MSALMGGGPVGAPVGSGTVGAPVGSGTVGAPVGSGAESAPTGSGAAHASPATDPVIGDGTTARSRARSRWRRSRWPLAVGGALLLVGLLAALPEPRTSQTALAPDNPRDSGARALAQVLEDQGVRIDYVRTSGEAVARATDGTTLLVTSDFLLTESQLQAVARTEADLVLLEPDLLLDAVTDAASILWQATPSGTELTAQCDDPDALAAGTITASRTVFQSLAPAAVVCFPGPDQVPGTGAYLVVDEERRVTAIGDSRILMNDTITTAGNAALALRALGRNAELTWYIPSLSDAGSDEVAAPGLTDLMPPVVQVLALQLLLVALVAGIWRARRLGRVVTEELPVTVRSAETTRGRGRLYRRSRSYGHAAAALRAGAAARSASRLGLPRSAGAHAVIDALARATGRAADEIAQLLYGPPPTDDAGLAQLARRLDELESEVHRS